MVPVAGFGPGPLGSSGASAVAAVAARSSHLAEEALRLIKVQYEPLPAVTWVLDAMRDLLGTKDWSAITLADVAKSAGISRQTIYNEFGSRHGLAQGYALRLADRRVQRE